MQKALSALCTILIWGALTLTHGEYIDAKLFGQCAVATNIDDFTDERSPELLCKRGDPNFGVDGVILFCKKQGFGVFLQAGRQFRMTETIDVLYRFDKGKLGKGSWKYSQSAAESNDKAVHDRFVEGIEKAKKLIFKVGDNEGLVDLTGSAGSVTEYKKRCSALSQ